jgi:PAS domain S-box-containing protein
MSAEETLVGAKADVERQVQDRSGVGGRFWQISPDLLGVLNADGCFERANPAWESVLGWSEAEVCSKSIFELLHPEDRERTRAGFEYLKQGNPILRFENCYRRKDGGYNWFAWAAAPLGDAYYCSGRDITEVQEAAPDHLLRGVAEDVSPVRIDRAKDSISAYHNKKITGIPPDPISFRSSGSQFRRLLLLKRVAGRRPVNAGWARYSVTDRALEF